MGAWVDKNSGMVFVSGVVLAIGGVAVLYATKTGGTVTNLAASALKQKPFQVFKIGKLTIQGQLLAFQPDKQILGAGVVATEKWQNLQVSISLGVIAAATTVQQVQGSIVLKTNDLNFGLNATDSLDTKTVNLGLSLGFNQGPLKPLKFGVGAVINDGKVSGYQGLATWTFHFN
ncbi:MAG TPA: hypothetical protein VKU19_28870 [Bryobacteraceae bacterium]|nr:hypothetical protein [Bryobacteraceae bacterium]